MCLRAQFTEICPRTCEVVHGIQNKNKILFGAGTATLFASGIVMTVTLKKTRIWNCKHSVN